MKSNSNIVYIYGQISVMFESLPTGTIGIILAKGHNGPCEGISKKTTQTAALSYTLTL